MVKALRMKVRFDQVEIVVLDYAQSFAPIDLEFHLYRCAAAIGIRRLEPQAYRKKA